MLLPVLVLSTAVPSRGLSLLALAAYGLMGFRSYRYRRWRGDAAPDARLYATFQILGKFAQGVGLVKFFVNRAFDHYRIIEYK